METLYDVFIMRKNGEVEKQIASGVNERTADRIYDGAFINLNHSEYYVCIEEKNND